MKTASASLAVLAALLLSGAAAAQGTPSPAAEGQPVPGTAPQPSITVNKAQPQVEVQQQQPQVTVEQAGGEPQIKVERMSRKEGSLADAGLGRNDLVGMEVRDQENDGIGKVSNLVLGADGQKIEQVMVELDTGFLGMGSKTVAVPWDQVRLSPQDKRVSVPLTGEQLKQAPEYQPPPDAKLLVTGEGQPPEQGQKEREG